jgi:hypothetical protein
MHGHMNVKIMAQSHDTYWQVQSMYHEMNNSPTMTIQTQPTVIVADCH